MTMDYPTGSKLPGMPWMTWLPDRKPNLKVHQSLRLAKSALGQTTGHPAVRNGQTMYPLRGGVLYQIVGGTWIVRAVIQPGTFRDEHVLFTAPRQWAKDPSITSVITEHPYAAAEQPQ